MAFSTNTSKTLGQINVTPLIDVVLVLLIIFLVTMPIMIKKVTLEVPRQIDEGSITTQTQIVVAIKADMSVTVDDGLQQTPCDLLQLPQVLRPLLQRRDDSEKAVFVAFEPQVSWTSLIETVDQIRGLAADADHNDITVALKTDPPPNVQP
jgi:biopolymer transport protein ExbD